MKNKILAIVTLAATVVVTSCQTTPYQGQARDTKKKPQESGVISLKENFRDEDRQKADEKMKSNCNPLTARIVEEGEIVIGQKVDTGSSETKRDDSRTDVGSLFGIPLTSGKAGGKDVNSSSTTTALREWQISYVCDTKKGKLK